MSAISTTIIGSYLGLQSVLDDILSTSPASTLPRSDKTGLDDPAPSALSSAPAPPTSATRVMSSSSLGPSSSAAPSSTPSTSGKAQWMEGWRRRAISALLISVPSMLIASTSPTLFLAAIDFAGVYNAYVMCISRRPRAELDRPGRKTSGMRIAVHLHSPCLSSPPPSWPHLHRITHEALTNESEAADRSFATASVYTLLHILSCAALTRIRTHRGVH